ncbi:23S rRNA (adenine(2503)-C(2))-methyltransferase RlmN [candidate division LCP-89 bacterium B3_LCP]|uniref:23S rRNA (Adenine(2503)-C(2))-methyltransferase RlmN n=1 Tax=candidate division LCP-89 bacterium B3_LCP TaxID=2012998 RepID=A0A532UXM1_UNCL8|nr:MAG: 23S rRNA (adenine(2503)-C(2))-methyltransferase RlmN [candidate division LCP-89 bacterium B3_LCP]
MESWGEKRFHGRQIFAALHRRGVKSVGEMMDLTLKLRERLADFEPLDSLFPVQELKGEDGTIKILFRLRDGEHIESVWIPKGDHATLCISTQAGCPLDCTFCATGKIAFKRNLSVAEIVDQVIYFRRLKSDLLLRNLVFMGMGEPLLNYDNLVRSIRTLYAADGSAISQRRMTVSTAGIVPKIEQLRDEGLKIKLAVSLNAPTDELRDRIMPINKKYPLNVLFKALDEFCLKSGDRITFEYTLMPGLNDTDEMIHALRKWLIKMPCKLNLIPLNPLDRRRRKQTDWDGIFDRFYEVFAKDKITLTLRRSRGAEIRAACGQLAGKTL